MVSATQLVGIHPGAFGVTAAARIQPALDLRPVDLRVELDGQVPADAEGLHAGRVAGQHGGLRRRQAAVTVELQPGTGLDGVGVGRLDGEPADLMPPHGLDPAAEGGADGLGAEADAQQGHPRLVGRAQPVKLAGDPGVGVVDRADRAQHHDVAGAVQGGQRGAAVRVQVDVQFGAPGLERVRDEGFIALIFNN